MGNDAEYRDECGRVVRVAGERLLLSSQPWYAALCCLCGRLVSGSRGGPCGTETHNHSRINPAFHLEVLPNRKCLKYLELYGITEAQGCFRGTLRYDVRHNTQRLPRPALHVMRHCWCSHANSL